MRKFEVTLRFIPYALFSERLTIILCSAPFVNLKIVPFGSRNSAKNGGICPENVQKRPILRICAAELCLAALVTTRYAPFIAPLYLPYAPFFACALCFFCHENRYYFFLWIIKNVI